MQRKGEGGGNTSCIPKAPRIPRRDAWRGWRPLNEAGTSAAVIIVWDQPGHLRESQPAPLPPPACSLLSPAPTRPARFVCASTAASLVAEGAEKTEKASRKPCQDPSPKPEGSLGPPRPQKAPALVCSTSSTSSRYTLPFPASLRCHDASGLELAPSRWRKAPESFREGAEDTGESVFPARHHRAPGAQPRRTQPENNIRASTMHIQSGIHLLAL